MRKLALGFALLAIPAAAHAATPLTFEQAQRVALEKVPGTVIETERSIHNGAVVFEFEIERLEGGVMEVEVDSATGKILELKVETPGPGDTMPTPEINKIQAERAATSYIEDQVSGLRAVEVIESEYTIVNDKFVYVVELRRGIKNYEVLVDVYNGSVVGMKEEGPGDR